MFGFMYSNLVRLCSCWCWWVVCVVRFSLCCMVLEKNRVFCGGEGKCVVFVLIISIVLKCCSCVLFRGSIMICWFLMGGMKEVVFRCKLSSVCYFVKLKVLFSLFCLVVILLSISRYCLFVLLVCSVVFMFSV